MVPLLGEVARKALTRLLAGSAGAVAGLTVCPLSIVESLLRQFSLFSSISRWLSRAVRSRSRRCSAARSRSSSSRMNSMAAVILGEETMTLVRGRETSVVLKAALLLAGC